MMFRNLQSSTVGLCFAGNRVIGKGYQGGATDMQGTITVNSWVACNDRDYRRAA